jgi:hypothetical protein
MQQISQMIKMGLRAAVWKATPNPPVAGLSEVLALAVLTVGVKALEQYFSAAALGQWTPYGFNALTTWLALFLITTALFFRPDVRATVLCGVLVFSILANLVEIAAQLIGTGTPWDPFLVFGIHAIWWLGAVFALLRSLEPESNSRRLVRIGGLWIATLLVSLALPHEPIFRSRDFDIRSANMWEYIPVIWRGDVNKEARRTVAGPAEAARVERSQPALLEDQASSLSAQRPGVTDIYVVGVAGWADQQVFRKELDGALDAFSRSFGTQGRTLKLVNDLDTVATSPIATRQNFAAAVRSVARVMDKQEDILLLFLTSHGSKGGIALSFAGLAYGSLTPADVAAVLADEGILNRIVIVSACYSGVFVKPLADYNTIVLTASDENSTSFGCSNERDWTYFGDALFNQSLLPGRNLETAFAAAKGLIAEWEARDGISASNPQAHFGLMLKDKLSAVYDFARSAEGQNLSP